MTASTVDVVVPMYRPGAWLAPCLDSVLSSRGVEVRLVVVDDLPGDEAGGAYVATLADTCLVVPRTNLGYATAVNRGLAVGNARYVLLLNQDARVEPDT